MSKPLSSVELMQAMEFERHGPLGRTETERGECECGAEGTRTVFPRRNADGGWRDETRKRLSEGPFYCAECRERKREEADRQVEDEERARQEASRRYDFERRLKFSRLPQRYHGLPTTDCPAGPLEDVRRWVKGEIDGLLFTGEPGTGKTHLAAVAAYEFMAGAEGRSSRSVVRWMSAPTIFSRLSMPFESEEHITTEKWLTEDMGPLVIDDLDKSSPREYAAGVIFSAIDHAWANNRKLIITTNLDVAELARRWPQPQGKAIASRIAGYCVQHKLDGPDRRLRSQAA